MKHARTLKLAGIVAAAFLAFAGTASATQLTSPAGTTYTGSLHASSVGHAVYHNAFVTFECAGTLSSNIEQHGVGLTIKGSVSEFSYTACTNNITVKTLKKGTMEVHLIAGTDNGTVTSNGAEIEVFFAQLGFRCIYSTINTHVGTLTSSKTTGGTAVLDVMASLPRTGGSVFCGSAPGGWTGTYKVSTPDSLFVDG